MTQAENQFIVQTGMQNPHSVTVIPMDAWYLMRAADLDLDELQEAYQAVAPVRPEPVQDEPVVWWPEQEAA